MSAIDVPSAQITTPPTMPLSARSFSKDSMFESGYTNPIDPHESFKNHFNKIHKEYKTTTTSNIEKLVDKTLNDEDSYFLNIVRDKTQSRVFGIKTPLGQVLKELQNSQESPRRSLLTKNIFDKAEKEAKALLETYFPASIQQNKKVEKIDDINSLEKRREINAVKIGEEFMVNNYTTINQLLPSITVSPNGNVVYIWQSNGQDGSFNGVYGQVCTPNGTKIGPEFQSNTFTPNSQSYASIAALSNNKFVVTWQSRDQDGWVDGVFAQIHNPDGSKSGNEFLVTAYVYRGQRKPSVIDLGSNKFFIIYEDDSNQESSYGIYGQIFNYDGSKSGGEVHVNSYTEGNQLNPSNALLTNGNSVAVWESNGQDGNRYGIYGQVLSPSGSKIGSELQVNTYVISNQDWPSVAALDDGFVVAWQSLLGQDGDGYGIFAQIFNQDGSKRGSELQVNTYWTSDQKYPSVARLNSSTFIVVWQSWAQDGEYEGIYGQIYNQDGSRAGSEFQINTYWARHQDFPAVAAVDANSFVVTWGSYYLPGGDAYDIAGQLFESIFVSSTSSTLTSTSSTSTSSTSSSLTSTSSSSTSSTTSSSTSYLSRASRFFTKNPETIDSSKNNSNLIKIILGIAIPIISCLGIGAAIFHRFKKRKNPSDLEKDNNTSRSFESQISSDHSESSDSFEMTPTIKRSHKKIGGKYYLLSKIYEDEAREIYDQTNYLIPFPDGKNKIKHTIGSGNFGKVKVAKRIKNKEYVGAKKIKGDDKIKKSEDEANLQKMAKGENVLPIYNTIRLDDTIYHFMPLAIADGLAIQQKLSSLKDRKLALEVFTYIAKDILTGIKTIHGKGINHLDIKPDNLLFMKDGVGYITDFGCAKKNDDPQTTTIDGDSRYFSPDRLKTYKLETSFEEEKADLWAAGVSLLQIYKNVFPFELFEQPKTFSQRINQCNSDFFKEKLNLIEELQNPEEGSLFWVIKSLLDPNPKNTFTETQALKASCFRTLNKDSQKKAFEKMQKAALLPNPKEEKEEDDDRENDQLVSNNEQIDFYGMNRDRGFYANNLEYGKTPSRVVSMAGYLKTPI